VEVSQLALTGGARINSNTMGAGAGGTVTVTAHDMIHITGRDSVGQTSGLSNFD